MINSGIMRMFIFLCNFNIYIFYFVSQVLCICTDDPRAFSMGNIIFLFVMILFFFYLIIWWGKIRIDREHGWETEDDEESDEDD
jgi:hypothetical protein